MAGRTCRVIVDTNFLMDLARFKADVDSIDELLGCRYELLMPKAVEEELARLKNKHAKAALLITRTLGVKAVSNPAGFKKTDDIVAGIAAELANEVGIGEVAVATNDAALRKRLKALGIKTIYLRARKHLEIS